MCGDLTKAAGPGRAAWNAVKKLNDLSVWNGVGKLADKRIAGGGGLGWKGTKRVADTMRGPVGLGLGIYGMAGMAMPSLPGADLAMNVGMPGWAAAQAVPNLINSARLTTDRNKKLIRRDAMDGAQAGANDFMTAVNMDPSLLSNQGGLRDFMKKNVGEFAGDSYMNQNKELPLSGWQKWTKAMTDSDGLVQNGVRSSIFDNINKQAGIGSALKTVGGGAMQALGALGFAGTGLALGKSIFGDKPYDPDAVRREGYAGAQAAIQKRLNGASSWERLAMKMDPTLAISGLEDKMPGTIKRWESATGNKYAPGWATDIKDAWKTGGKPTYFTHDAEGTRHYIS